MTSRKRRNEWFDDEALWRETYSFMFPDSRIAAADETVQEMLQLVGAPGKTALDLCCGPGRCSIALAARGYAVTGVDRTKFLLDKARENARKGKYKIEWIHQDMRDFVRPASFDLALSIFTSFGYFENRTEDTHVLENIFKSLRPAGVLVIELMGKETLARIFQPSSAESLPDGSMLVEQRKVVDGWSRIHNEWTIFRDGRTSKFQFHLNLYSGQEMREKLEQAGFTNVQLFGNFIGEPYGPGANRLIAIGRKL